MRPGTLRLRVRGGRERPLFASPPRVRRGLWSAAFVSPDGKHLLLEWSGGCQTPSGWCRDSSSACEVSTAYFAPATGGAPERIGRDPSADTKPFGWTPDADGRALVLRQADTCGAPAASPGVYAV